MYQNLLISPNSIKKLNQVILNILQGINIKENQLKLNQIRKSTEYPHMLCQILADCLETTFSSMKQTEIFKKSFIALQIKKISERTSTDQCWRLMRQVYYSQLDKKVASLIRQTCLLYHPSSPQNNLLYIFLEIDLQYKGIKGIVRYMTFVHELVKREFRELQNKTMREYGQDVVEKLVAILGWDIGEIVGEGVMSALVLVYGLVGNLECWNNIQMWDNVIRRFISELGRTSPLIRCLGKHLIQEISQRDSTYILSNELQFNPNELNEALLYCLKQTADSRLSIQECFLFDCIQILSLYWVKNVRKFTQNHQLQDSQNMALDIIQTYSEEFSDRQHQNGCQLQFNDDEEQRDTTDTELNKKRLSFLKTVLYMYPIQKLIVMVQTRTSYAMQIMQFSLYMPTLLQDNFLPLQLFETVLFNLQTTLANQTDSYLFIKQKQTFVFTLLKYLAKFYHSFERPLLLRICYLVDFLVYKCDTIADQGFKILDVLTERIIDLEGFELVEFLSTTLGHINENEWLETHHCYFHAITILLNISPQLVFERPSIHQYSEFSQLEKQILIMTGKMIQILQKSFDYQSMHKLNSLLQHLLQPHGAHLINSIDQDQFSWVVTTNFKSLIMTESSCDIYSSFIRLSKTNRTVLNSLDNYNFWKQCDSQQLVFFTNIYIRLIDASGTQLNPTEKEQKVMSLKKNIWERYRMEIDDEEREKIVDIFAKNPKYLEDLCIEAYQGQKWSQNRKTYYGQTEQRRGTGTIRENMQIQI